MSFTSGEGHFIYVPIPKNLLEDTYLPLKYGGQVFVSYFTSSKNSLLPNESGRTLATASPPFHSIPCLITDMVASIIT